MADLPDLALAVLRSAIAATVEEIKRKAKRLALRMLVWIFTAFLLTVVVVTCVVIGVVRLGNGLLAMTHECIARGWLADLIVGGSLLLIPAIVLAITARCLRTPRQP